MTSFLMMSFLMMSTARSIPTSMSTWCHHPALANPWPNSPTRNSQTTNSPGMNRPPNPRMFQPPPRRSRRSPPSRCQGPQPIRRFDLRTPTHPCCAPCRLNVDSPCQEQSGTSTNCDAPHPLVENINVPHWTPQDSAVEVGARNGSRQSAGGPSAMNSAKVASMSRGARPGRACGPSRWMQNRIRSSIPPIKKSKTPGEGSVVSSP